MRCIYSVMCSGICAVGVVLILAGCDALQTGRDRMAGFFESAAPTRGNSTNSACPQAVLAPDLERISEYVDPLRPAADSLLLVTRMDRLTARCARDSNGQNIVQLTIAYSAQLGPAGRARPTDTPSFSSPTFVALIGTDGTILSKNNAAISATFPPAVNIITLSESLRFPLPADQTIGTLMVGFQLDEQQLINNRAPLNVSGQVPTTANPLSVP